MVILGIRTTVLALLGFCCGSFVSANIHETASRHGSFGTLVAALDITRLTDDLSAPGPFTLFAPTDNAFGSLPPGLLRCLLRETNRSVLESILLYHVASGAVYSDDLFQGQRIPTLLSGAQLTVDFSEFLKINDSIVIGVDLEASNGVVHAISSVLIPPGTNLDTFLANCIVDTEPSRDIPSTAVGAGVFDTLVAALTATDLVGALSTPAGPFTVFGPTDAAFADLPEGLLPCLLREENLPLLSSILRYHVVEGARVLSTDLVQGQLVSTLLDRTVVEVDLTDGIKINESRVINADVLASNGVIHIIDEVLIPPGTDVEGFLSMCVGADDTRESLLGLGLTTLEEALSTADLVEEVSVTSFPATIFGPTDEAFASLPEGLLRCLLDDESTLSAILLYHVVDGGIMSTDLTDGRKIRTVNGEEVTVAFQAGSIKIDDATVINADNTFGTNGIVHVIDAVLVPENVDVEAFLGVCLGTGDVSALIEGGSTAYTVQSYVNSFIGALFVVVALLL